MIRIYINRICDSSNTIRILHEKLWRVTIIWAWLEHCFDDVSRTPKVVNGFPLLFTHFRIIAHGNKLNIKNNSLLKFNSTGLHRREKFFLRTFQVTSSLCRANYKILLANRIQNYRFCYFNKKYVPYYYLWRLIIIILQLNLPRKVHK